MKLVIDVNVLFSAIIRESTTRELLVKSEHDFYFPEPSKEKIIKYADLLKEKSGLNYEELQKLLKSMFSNIKPVPEEGIMMRWDEANAVMGHIDPEDVVFIASALAIDADAIWSDDKHFQEQAAVSAFTTKDVLELQRQ